MGTYNVSPQNGAVKAINDWVTFSPLGPEGLSHLRRRFFETVRIVVGGSQRGGDDCSPPTRQARRVCDEGNGDAQRRD